MFGEKLRNAPAKLIQALREEGFSMEETLSLAENRFLLRQLRRVIENQQKKTQPVLSEVRKIDLSASPYVPPGFELKDHQDQKLLKWNPFWNPGRFWFLSSIDLGVDEKCTLSDVLMKVDNHHALNANMLDFYLQEPELIPKELKHCETIFPATRYTNCREVSLVRILYCNSGSWDWGWMKIEDKFREDHRIAVFSGN